MDNKPQNKLRKIILAIVQPEEVIAGKHLKKVTFWNRFLKNMIFFGILTVIGLVVDWIFIGIHDRIGWIVEMVCLIITDIIMSVICALIEVWWYKFKHRGTEKAQ